MLKIENKTREQAADKKSEKSQKADGIASSFEQKEVKNLFMNYLTTMLVIEGCVFFFCFINHLATPNSVFPWKPYLFATFITPIAITFVFGLILLTFNKFFFKESGDGVFEPNMHQMPASWRKGQRISTFLHVIYRLPFLFSMVLLIGASVLAYKLDDIAFYAFQIGSGVARYVFFTLIGGFVIMSIGIIIWMVLSFRLRQQTMTTDHQYRMQLMDKFGMVLLEDGTMLNKDGKMLNASAQLGNTEQTAQLSSDDIEQISYTGANELEIIEGVEDDAEEGKL